MQCTQNVAFANHNDGGNNYYWAICMYICIVSMPKRYVLLQKWKKNKEELTMIIISM